MSEPLWKDAAYLESQCGTVRNVRGLVYRGLAMRKLWKGSPKGRRPPCWVLVHMGTGHAVLNITAHMVEAFDIATEFAEMADWTFEGLQGYINQDPDLPVKVRQKAAPFGSKISFGGGGNNEELAREVAMARA